MNFQEIVSKKWGMLVTVGFLFSAVAFAGFLMLEKNFKSEVKFLIVQEQAGAQDYYSLSKSAEYLGKIMGEAIHSELFIEEVIKTGKVNEEFLPFDKKERMKEWARMVKVSGNYQLGTIEVSIYSNSSREIVGLSEAIISVLTEKNNLFRGGSQSIQVRVLSGPIVEKNPTFANIALIMLGGFLLGVSISVLWLYYLMQSFTTVSSDDYFKSLDKIELNR